MLCPADQTENPPGALLCTRCGERLFLLAGGSGLPYPAWEFSSASPARETRLSLSRLARDRRTGNLFAVREYLPLAPPQGALESFVRTAKSLREAALPEIRTLFPYTSAGRWFAVSPPLNGLPISRLHGGDAVPEAEVLLLLRALLGTFVQFHATRSATGLLYHGGLGPENILLREVSSGGRPELHLRDPLFLEQFLISSPLPPEHHDEQDLRSGALAMRDLLDRAPARTPLATRLDRVQGVVLGAMLDTMLRPAQAAPSEAAQALALLEEIAHAVSNGDRDLLGGLAQQLRSLIAQ